MEMMIRILQAIRGKDMIQIQMAEKLGVAKSSVSQWRSNNVQPPLSKLNTIAEATGCDVTELIVSKKKK